MPITGAYFWYTGNFNAYGGGGETNTAPWTADAGIPPSSVLAISSLTHYDAQDLSGADVGYLSYWTQDPRTRVTSKHTLSPEPAIFQGLGLTPSFYDNNVIIITRAWNCFSSGQVDAIGNFTVFVWE
ncbi:hypothetical protein [Mycobacterium sp.]|uniref:hypothetical protein n=1 Tax=Mycobacterium sp. TaxID=1785 RepID=UPI003F96259C